MMEDPHGVQPLVHDMQDSPETIRIHGEERSNSAPYLRRYLSTVLPDDSICRVTKLQAKILSIQYIYLSAVSRDAAPLNCCDMNIWMLP